MLKLKLQRSPVLGDILHAITKREKVNISYFWVSEENAFVFSCMLFPLTNCIIPTRDQSLPVPILHVYYLGTLADNQHHLLLQYAVHLKSPATLILPQLWCITQLRFISCILFYYLNMFFHCSSACIFPVYKFAIFV